MRKYDYSFLKKEIPGSLVGTAEIIADIHAKEMLRKLQFAGTFEKLKEKALIASV